MEENDFVDKLFSTLDSKLPNVVNDDGEQLNETHNFNGDDCSFEELDIPITVSEIITIIRSLNKKQGICLLTNLINEYFIESL